MMEVTNSKAYEYCKNSVRKKTTPKYVKKRIIYSRKEVQKGEYKQTRGLKFEYKK